jgi:hypothetical protein
LYKYSYLKNNSSIVIGSNVVANSQPIWRKQEDK